AVLAHPMTNGLAAVLGAAPRSGAPGHQISRQFRNHSSSEEAAMTTPTGVLLMTFGSAQTAGEVPDYLRSVRGGGDPDPAVLADFQRRYEIVGWSPLVRITGEQGAALQVALDEAHG